MSKYLQLSKSGVFYFRMRIPKDVQQYFASTSKHGRLIREFKKSLKTHNRKTAERLAAQYAAQAEELFSSLRKPCVTDLPLLKSINVSALERKLCDSSRLVPQVVAPETSETVLVLLSKIIQQIAGSLPAVTSTVNATIELPDDTTVPNLRLSSAIDKFLTEKRALEPKSQYYLNDVPDDLHMLLRVLGDVEVMTINRDCAVNFFNILKRLPPNLNKSPLYREKTIEQILKTKAKPRSASTVNGVLISCSALFTWLQLYGHVKQDFFAGLRMPRKKGGRDRFDDADLIKIFSDKIFTNHDFEHSYRYWIPLIALHSGMRMNEILQLRPQDIRTEDGILMMHVVDETEEMSVKTEAGLRRVPVHPTLIGLGFATFIYSRRNDGWIFDGLTVAKDGRRSYKASKWFTSTFRPRVGLGLKGKDFHSFRHTVIDDLKQEQANLHVIKALVGHSDKLSSVSGEDITFDRYGKRYKARILYNMICKLDYSRVLAKVKKWEK